MNQVAGTITGSMVLKRADELAEGDIIPGGDAVNGHRVEVVTTAKDPMLGMVVRVWVREMPRYRDDETVYPALSYIFRPFDKHSEES